MTGFKALTLVRTEWRTITFLLLLTQNVVVVQPEDGVDVKPTMPPDGYIRLTRDVIKHESRAVDVTQEEQSNKKQSFQTKPRFLCLHGHGSNAARLQNQLNVWPKDVLDKMDFVFLNGPFPLNDSSPGNQHFEWYTLEKGAYKNFDEGMAYIDDFMLEFGPFDGVLGFSQGAFVAGALPGMQNLGILLTRVEKIQHVVLISGAKFGVTLFPMPKFAENIYSSPINIPSLHIFGENDVARSSALQLIEEYVDPLVIYHHGGHEVPKLDDEGLKIMNEFLQKITGVV